MFIERKINQSTGTVEMWACEWVNQDNAPAHKSYIQKVGDEQEVKQLDESQMAVEPAICWSYGRTLGNIAVYSQAVLGLFPGKRGDDAVLPCDIVHAGKFRHGAERWWCRTHQTHWGTKADQQSASETGELRCANHTQTMNYVVAPFSVNVNDHAEVGIWCSMPAAISTVPIPSRPPKIHVHVRDTVDGRKVVDRDFDAISVLYSKSLGLFGNEDITRVNVTPPAAFEFVRNLDAEVEMDCVNCSTCGYPHLDLGDFAIKPHRKHFCGNCGRDSTWSKTSIISTPLKLLHHEFAKTLNYVVPDRSLSLDEYPGCSYTVWASTPAIVWTAERPQEFGIHVHVHEGNNRVVDDTFAHVELNGRPLDRSDLVQSMINRTIV